MREDTGGRIMDYWVAAEGRRLGGAEVLCVVDAVLRAAVGKRDLTRAEDAPPPEKQADEPGAQAALGGQPREQGGLLRRPHHRRHGTRGGAGDARLLAAGLGRHDARHLLL